MTDDHASFIMRALALPCWVRPEKPRALTGGKTNHNILVEDQGRTYVVRLGDDIPVHGIMRWNELAICRAAHAAGLAPAVHYAAPGVLVLDYVDAVPMIAGEGLSNSVIVDLGVLLKRVHREVLPHVAGPILGFWVFHVIRDYGRFLREKSSPHRAMLPDLLRQAEELEKLIGPVTVSLCHNDLLPGNILRSGERFWLIDWEYAGLGSPLFDLGGLASNFGFTPDQERLLLQSYFGDTPDVTLMQRYDAMKCASLLRETLWSMVSELISDVDVDYAAYSLSNLNAYRVAFGRLQHL